MKLVVLLFLSGFRGFALPFAGADLEIAFVPEYNRSFYFSWETEVFGSFKPVRDLCFTGGLALGRSKGEWDVNAVVSAEYGFPFFRPYVPLYLKAVYQYNGFPGYETDQHTLVPLLSLRWKWVGGALGPAFRFTRFGEDPALYEMVLSYSVYIMPFESEEAAIRLGIGNTGDFQVKNLGSYACFLGSRFHITGRIFLTGETEITFSGNVGHITSIYGIAIKQGVLFSW